MPRAEIRLVFSGPSDREWLRRLREWMDKDGRALGRLGIDAAFTPETCPDKALEWRAELPDERVVVTFGFSPGQIQASRLFAVSGEPIIVRDPQAPRASDPSATFLDRGGLVACSDVRPQVRKSLIRMALRKRVTVRCPNSEKELSEYFALRYRVWSEDGYLRDKNRAARTAWELDYWDRTAVPVIAATRDGSIIGCARLIQEYGHEEQPFCAQITSLLAHGGDPVLGELFTFPRVLRQPFDVLQEFPGFRAHYHELVRRGYRSAEVGRVVVAPEHRGQFLSEVLVDTAASCAEMKGIDCLFLACRDELETLYGRCGFQLVPGLRADKFFNIAVPSIVMQKWVSDPAPAFN